MPGDWKELEGSWMRCAASGQAYGFVMPAWVALFPQFVIATVTACNGPRLHRLECRLRRFYVRLGLQEAVQDGQGHRPYGPRCLTGRVHRHGQGGQRRDPGYGRAQA